MESHQTVRIEGSKRLYTKGHIYDCFQSPFYFLFSTLHEDEKMLKKYVSIFNTFWVIFYKSGRDSLDKNSRRSPFPHIFMNVYKTIHDIIDDLPHFANCRNSNGRTMFYDNSLERYFCCDQTELTRDMSNSKSK